MISLSVGHHNIQLNTQEAAYLAEGLMAAACGRKNPLPAFTSNTLGVLSVTAEDVSSEDDSHFRSNPQQSDQVLTDC
ncbi:hypothetical protein [Rahnella victoriana]|uniref:hypothetical protein n=1 Tax=Rahnella victoriana TaxID=1510570 RepID=UPI0010399623|nr:hypothetical protein [Rahnella victoriana]TBX32167.1 hypothetical protein EYY67_19320 [Rahnella victoriana]